MCRGLVSGLKFKFHFYYCSGKFYSMNFYLRFVERYLWLFFTPFPDFNFSPTEPSKKNHHQIGFTRRWKRKQNQENFDDGGIKDQINSFSDESWFFYLLIYRAVFCFFSLHLVFFCFWLQNNVEPSLFFLSLPPFQQFQSFQFQGEKVFKTFLRFAI